jgi:excisionase family DNA binding protein
MKQARARRLTSIEHAAEELSLSRATIYRLHAQGQLPFVKIGSRTLVDVADIDRMIAGSKKSQVA